MGMRVEDIGEFAYGGLVKGAEEWDKKRMTDGAITQKEVFKKFSTYAYVVPGGLATVMSAFGIWRQAETWAEHVSHGFIYDFPRFLVNVINDMRETAGTDTKSAAVKEAQRIMREAKTKQLGSGHPANRTYNPEFEEAQKYAW